MLVSQLPRSYSMGFRGTLDTHDIPVSVGQEVLCLGFLNTIGKIQNRH